MVLLRGRRRGCVILLLSVCLCPSVACVAFVSHRSPVSYVVRADVFGRFLLLLAGHEQRVDRR